MIPEAAVEAAAMVLCEQLWDNAHESQRSYAREEAREALEAAAPHMLAEITTRVEQVNLPNGTVILTEQGGIFQHFNGYWFEPASSYRHHLDDITLPATVIHRPTP